MEYIQRIREKLGSEKILIPATAVVILNDCDEILLHERTDTQTWGLPGGLMDIGETVMEAAVREVREETGLTVSELKLFGVFSGPRFEVRYPGGDQTAPVIFGFFTRTFVGKLADGNESAHSTFFPIDSLPSPMNEFHEQFVFGLLEYRKRGEESPIFA